MGEWVNKSGYEILMQNRDPRGGYACGMACAAMVVHRKGHGKPTIASMSGLSQDFGGAFKRGTAFRAGAVQVLPATKVTAGGTAATNLVKTLKSMGIQARIRAGFGPPFPAFSSRNPVIANVRVGGKYDHFVLLNSCDPNAPKGLIICDPETGLLSASPNATHFRSGANDCTYYRNWFIVT
ncbi:MAG: hypothetical protein B6D72_00345 [gamma proteobacterium symbiont of Ctena orbiculata]|uniref:Uncharacterized protein n=1 Tax=Candidatus Thiodiazotropha taylori TaxID=2792791 RepID=A0A944MFK8_9GAMM|nr:hypothetical protein [Candidatus Thiodiazotropha taylori]PUB85532.1 MAG: hypothetical protein DBP00_13020 [gamma proteobacterium symbiont of Ctena orbiculata]MBT3029359.1 hypothetical protein [Candidatus Thiodiazotropha taylori]MBT3037164.1 hypothetical protein [Candidatus Thiodiazotropha taylori]PVV13860.1 MAG: hypothetical protein B6D82_07150 [gamma proteobacterium symbiont of Ctena orbiculata]